MSKQEFIERFRHKIIGHVCEGVYAGRRDEMLAKWMRLTMTEIDKLLGEMYESLLPKETHVQSQSSPALQAGGKPAQGPR